MAGVTGQLYPVRCYRAKLRLIELLVVIAALLLFDIAAALWGVDTRPGFDGGRDDHKERWFIHSKTD